MRHSRTLLRLALASAAMIAAAAAQAQTSDAAVKAAFLPRFARYVTWPPAALPKSGDPFVLCTIGDDPFGQLLDQAARTQTIDGHNIVIRRLSSAEGADRCNIAFVEGSQSVPVGQMLAAIGSKPVLTVTDGSNGGQRGIIHFAVVNGRVRFFIDEGGAARRGMTISSRLLALALGVRQR
jgi:uncharacterized protein DUF4154